MEDSDTIYWYCSECLSIDIRYDDNGSLYCHHCGAGPESMDWLPIWQWMEKYAKRYKKLPIEAHSPYDDLHEIYEEETAEVETEANAYASGMTVMDVMQRNLTKLDKI